MSTPEQDRATEPRSAKGSESLVMPIGFLILAIICGAGALVLTVFGVWPALLLVIASAIAAAVAVGKINKNKDPSMN